MTRASKYDYGDAGYFCGLQCLVCPLEVEKAGEGHLNFKGPWFSPKLHSSESLCVTHAGKAPELLRAAQIWALVHLRIICGTCDSNCAVNAMVVKGPFRWQWPANVSIEARARTEWCSRYRIKLNV